MSQARKQLAGQLGVSDDPAELLAWQACEPPFTSPPVSMEEDDVDRCDICNKILTTRDPMMRICLTCLDETFGVGATP